MITITPKKIVGYKGIARIRMMLSGQDVYQLKNGLISKKTDTDQILLYTQDGKRYTHSSGEITVQERKPLFASK